MRVSARGLKFDVREAGPHDGAAVLLLHGFPQHGGMWDGVVPALHDAGLRTYAPDQRGYSRDARPSDVDTYRMDECVRDAVAILDALGVGQAHVVGHDWGSVVGWHLAAEHPDRVRTFTAVSVPHPMATILARRIDDQKARSSYMELFAIQDKAERVLLEDGARRLWALFEPLDRDQAAPYVRPLLEPGALTGALNWYRRLGRVEVGPSTVPVTYLWGTADPAISRASAHGCAAFVSTGVDYRFVELPDVGHWVVDEAPVVVAAEVLALVARHRVKRPTARGDLRPSGSVGGHS